LRPPTPGAPRPQEKARTSRQASDRGAGPGEPGKAGSGFPPAPLEDGLPDIGRRSGQVPDPNAAVSDQSLSSKLLGYDGASGGAVEKRETTR